MKLSILPKGETADVQTLHVRLVASIKTTDKGECLYYETFNDLEGKGSLIPLSQVECWEVEVIYPGGNCTRM